jgi:heme-degrading monooxygenase HmoA
MVIRITWGKLQDGTWSGFERTYRENVVTKGKDIKGLRGRWLAQDADDKNTGFAVSLWDNLADMKAYEQSPLYREIVAPLQPFFVGEYRTYRCEVKYVEGAAPSR